MRYNVYKKLVATLLFITCMEILLCSASIIPIVSSMNSDNSTIETTFDDKIISNQGFGRYIYRFRLFGPIYNLSIDGDDYEFKSNNLRGLRIRRYWERDLSWRFLIEYFHSRGIGMNFWGSKFRGIITPHFICGCFYSTHWI